MNSKMMNSKDDIERCHGYRAGDERERLLRVKNGYSNAPSTLCSVDAPSLLNQRPSLTWQSVLDQMLTGRVHEPGSRMGTHDVAPRIKTAFLVDSKSY